MSETKGKKSGRKKKRIVRRITVILLILVLAGGGGFYAWTRLKDEYTVTYDQYTATTGTISNSLSFSGTLALTDSRTYTASSSATVRNVYVKAGDKVSKGDRLIRLSTGNALTADFDGTVNVISVEKDDEVAQGDNLIQIADFEHMKASFRVDEYDIGDVHPGDTVTITATATEKTFRSSVDTINYISSSNGNVAYYTATANVDVDGEVYPGMQVTVTIPQEEATDVVVLKQDALSFTLENQAFVYIMDESGALQEQTVEVGVSNGNYVEIKSGLTSGDVVYTVSKEKEDSLNSLFSSMFGSQRFNRPSGGGSQYGGGSRNGNGNGNWNRNNQNGGRMPGGN